jgi:hypothetical protein
LGVKIKGVREIGRDRLEGLGALGGAQKNPRLPRAVAMGPVENEYRMPFEPRYAIRRLAATKSLQPTLT